MSKQHRKFESVTAPAREEAQLGDLRFRKLLGAAEWNVLPPEVRTRFSKRLQGGATALYVGEVTEVRASRAGRLIAQALRLIGAPLPLFSDVGVATVVSVTEDHACGGQIWSRTYCNRRGFPQVIHSTKRFEGATGLEEHVGFGITMALCIAASTEGLAFTSAGYSIRVAGLRIPLPRWLSPGEVLVTHRALTEETFAFTMTLRHALFGELIHQAAVYHDA